MNLAAIGLYDNSATGDFPAAGTGVSCYTVTAAGARCEFFPDPFMQYLVDNVRLSRYVEMRDLLMDDMCVFVGIDVCPQACLSDRR